MQEGAAAGTGESQLLQVTYNAGLQALQLHNYAAALQCFQVSRASTCATWMHGQLPVACCKFT